MRMPSGRPAVARVAAAALFVSFLLPNAGCDFGSETAEETVETSGTLPGQNVTRYRAIVRRTTGGFLHVKADDWGSLGYGYGHAFASDNICVLMRELLVATGQLSKYFGPDGGNLESDAFYAFWSNEQVAQSFFEEIDPDLQELGRGYAAGVNRFIADKGPEGLPEDCRGEPWVKPITITDLFSVYHKLVTRAGATNLVGFIANAAPPAPLAAGQVPPPAPLAAGQVPPPAPKPWEEPETLAAVRDQLPEWKPEEIGSNMIGLGKDATENGSGMLLVNPHFPWTGPLRFYQVHVTIPGVIDSMGGSIFGSPLPNIAFNKDIAWSHTVSAASRFAIYRLNLVPGNPTSYLVDGVEEAMTPVTVEVEVLQPDGSIATVERTLWDTRLGPVADLIVPFNWTASAAFVVADPNRKNTRIFDQYLRMNQATSVDEMLSILDEEIALPWINTVMIDREGNTAYADIGSMPNITTDKLVACGAQVLGLFVLDGSREECLLGQAADAPGPEILGASELPRLKRTDYVQNSNDTYWITHPDALLEGFSPVLGGERYPQGFRTRLGIAQIEERLAGTDGKAGNRFSLQNVVETVYDNRNYSAELAQDDVVAICSSEPQDVGGVDVGPACDVLAGWDGRNLPTSVGTHVWKEFWTRVDDDVVWVVPFDADDGANTPRDLDQDDPALRAAVMQALADAVERIARLGVPIDAAWGDVQFEVKDGERLPISGGSGGEGVYNAIGGPRTDGVGYSPISSGTSIFEAITFDERGPVAKGLITYSQSSDPANPHFGDQTRVFSDLETLSLPFHDDEIRSDPGYSVRVLRERLVEWRARRDGVE